MWVITLNRKPATLPMIDKLDGGTRHYDPDEERTVICSLTRRDAIATYIYNFGYTWPDRHKGVQVVRAELDPCVK